MPPEGETGPQQQVLVSSRQPATGAKGRVVRGVLWLTADPCIIRILPMVAVRTCNYGVFLGPMPDCLEPTTTAITHALSWLVIVLPLPVVFLPRYLRPMVRAHALNDNVAAVCHRHGCLMPAGSFMPFGQIPLVAALIPGQTERVPDDRRRAPSGPPAPPAKSATLPRPSASLSPANPPSLTRRFAYLVKYHSADRKRQVIFLHTSAASAVASLR
ncbi:unnamed protein product [Soboliphyme baturini]|uniref:G_PROTEIN_RECEP_F1_2 domain-containing protein n=1 Tax=Soboliphyme baturini TaxID=241478 RepID=A0A183J3Q3_9BILA|nr:unnamed protein product [Soboliphyme baturini]